MTSQEGAVENKARGDSSPSARLVQYQELARLAYSVLSQCPSLPALSVSMGNPRHPLPAEYLALGDRLESDKSAPPLTLVAKEWTRCLLYALRETLRILRLKWRAGRLLRQARRVPAEVVMKTWVFGSNGLSNEADFYYGTLPRSLQQRGIRCVLLCGDALGGAAEQDAFARRALSQTHMRYIPEKAMAPVWAPLLIACDQLITSLKLRRLGQKSKNRKFSTVSAHACLDCLRPHTTAASLYFYIARTAVKNWGPKVFMTLYEGQAWEKSSWLGAKMADRNCVTVGYQHTVVMPHSLSLISPNNGSWKPQTPDCVLCLGEATIAMMKPGHRLNGTRFVPFGSFRRAPGDSLPRPPKPGRRTVVVVPEGIIPEAKLLFNCALLAASSAADHHFILRCHPMLPFERVRPHLERDPEALPNVEISEGPIENDFARSSVVLYRGSSSVMYAVLHGLKPIYLHNDEHQDVDPLFELAHWREYVSSPDEVRQLLQQYAETSEESASEQWKSAFEYVSTYTMPVGDASIDRFLTAVGLSRGQAVK